MGRDLEDFVHPERISAQLICPICTQVLENPVQTASEHLFCEEELLEWMTRSALCPVTKRTIDPAEIRRPGRVILNMLAELEVFCCNRARGCAWTGPQDLLEGHAVQCDHRPAEEWRKELARRDEQIEALEQRVEELEQRLRVYEALAPGAPSGGSGSSSSSSSSSDVDRLRRLERLVSLESRK